MQYFHSITTYLFSVFFLFFAILPSYAQDGMQDKQLIIEKNKVIELPKITRKPIVLPKEEFKTTVKPQQYDLTFAHLYLPAINFSTVSPSLLPKEVDKKVELPENYVKGGFGNYTTLFGELYLQVPQNKDYGLAFFAHHLSSRNGAIAEEKSGISRTKLGLEMNYKISNSSSVTGQIRYRRTGLGYYGYGEEALKNITESQIAQTYHFLNFAAAYQDKADENMNITLKTAYDYFSTKTDMSETQVNIAAGTTYKFNEKSDFLAEIMVNFATRKDSLDISRNLLAAKLQYQFAVDKFNFVVGTNLVLDNDTLKENSNFRIYPHVEINYAIGSKIMAYAHFTGNTLPTSLQQFANENNFISNKITLLHTNKQWETALGVKGAIAQKIGYHVKGSYAQYKNLYFFNNSFADSAKFEVLYDIAGTKVFNLLAEIEANLSPNLKAKFSTSFFNYNTTSIAKAWHRPNFINTFTLTYQPIPKLQGRMEIFNQAGLIGYNAVSKREYNLPSIFDANLQADYQITPKISAFAKLNNIFSQQYQPFLYYTMQRFNALVGVMWKF
jgi:hypothetical protein